MPSSKWKYHPPTREDIDRRVNQTAGSFKSYIKADFTIYKVKTGDNLIRILPRLGEDKHSHHGLEIWNHPFIGPDKVSLLCLHRMKDKPCPVCEEWAATKRRGEDEREAYALAPRKRVLVWLLDRSLKEQDQSPLLWAMPWREDQEIATKQVDKFNGKLRFIDDPELGHDLAFERKGNTAENTQYLGWDLSREPSLIADRHLEYVTNHPLETVLHWYSYQEAKNLFEGNALSENGQEDQPHKEQTRKEPPKDAPWDNERETEAPKEESKQEGEDIKSRAERLREKWKQGRGA